MISTMNKTEDDNSIGEVNSIVLIILYSTIALIGANANISIIVTVLRNRSLRKKQHLILLNLIACDLLTTLLSAPYYIYSVSTTPSPPATSKATNLCKSYLLFSYTLGYVSIQSMLLISLDRYIAVVYPYFYQKHMTSNKIILLTVFCWLAPFIFCVPSTFMQDWLMYDGRPGGFCGVQWSNVSKVFVFSIFGIMFVLPTVIVFFTNIRVYKIARKQCKISPEQSINRKISNQSQVTTVSDDEIRTTSDTTTPRHMSISRFSTNIRRRLSKGKTGRTQISKREVQIAVATLLLIGFYLLSWLPFVIPRMLSTSGIYIPRWLISYTPVFVFSSVAWDPLLILWCRNEIRGEVKKMLHLTFAKKITSERNMSVTNITLSNSHVNACYN